MQTWTLENGLRVYFKRLPGAPSCRVSLTVEAGAGADPPGKNELAHLVEHLAPVGRLVEDLVEGAGAQAHGQRSAARQAVGGVQESAGEAVLDARVTLDLSRIAEPRSRVHLVADRGQATNRLLYATRAELDEASRAVRPRDERQP